MSQFHSLLREAIIPQENSAGDAGYGPAGYAFKKVQAKRDPHSGSKNIQVNEAFSPYYSMYFSLFFSALMNEYCL